MTEKGAASIAGMEAGAQQSVVDLERRVQELEKWVGKLQERIYDLEMEEGRR